MNTEPVLKNDECAVFFPDGKERTVPGISVSGFGGINLERTLFCGQAFRWRKTSENCFYGITSGAETVVCQKNTDELFFTADEKAVKEIWAPYFDLERDYVTAVGKICECDIVKQTVGETGIIHILNQDPWEALVSFIISACNNIPRISGIVARLCENFGRKLGYGYAFPSARDLCSKSEEDLSCLRAGYRVPYILDAAKKVEENELDLSSLYSLSEDEARACLMSVKGVGRKVADCTLLFSLGFFDSYPVDRHIKRANEEYFPNGLPSCFDGAKGLAQQYLFIYRAEMNNRG